MSTYKDLKTSTEQVATRTLLHEAIPLTGSISSGSYSDSNIKDFSKKSNEITIKKDNGIIRWI